MAAWSIALAKTREDRDQQHLQEIAAGERPEIAVGNDRHQMRDDAFFLGLGDVGSDRFRIDRSRIDVEAGAGLQQLADDQADRQRDRGNRLEIDQRLEADPADTLQIAHRGNAVHHGAENHRCDHHLDQRDKAVAERLQLLAEIRIEVPDQDAKRDRDENLDVKDLVPRLAPGGRTDRFCGHGRLAWGEKELAAPSWERAARPTTKIPVFMARSNVVQLGCLM